MEANAWPGWPTEDAEIAVVADWLSEQFKAGVLPHELEIFVRSEGQLDRAKAAVGRAALLFQVLDEEVETTSGHVSISIMHFARRLEFRSVAVLVCDDAVIPLQDRIQTVGDESDLQEVYDTERHFLYVVCTRDRDQLFVTGVEPASVFRENLLRQGSNGHRPA